MREIDDIRDALGGVPTGGGYLDVGSGTGAAVAVLAKEFPGVRMVAADLVRSPAADIPGVEFCKCPAHDMPFAEGEFAIVTCCDVLEHIVPAYLNAAIIEIGRVCGGRLMFGIPSFAAHAARYGMPELGKLHLTVRPLGWWGEKLRELLPQFKLERHGKWGAHWGRWWLRKS